MRILLTIIIGIFAITMLTACSGDPEIITKIVYVEVTSTPSTQTPTVIPQTTPTVEPTPYIEPTPYKKPINRGVWNEPKVTPKPTSWKYAGRRHTNKPEKTPPIRIKPTIDYTIPLGLFDNAFVQPTKAPIPTLINNWVDTYNRVGGWCYLIRTNKKTGEVRDVPRKQIIYWDYHNNGIENKYKIECKAINGKEHCSSTMPPKLFNEWYNKFGINIENQPRAQREGCTK